jgi:ATP-independent RNA helicase DbpA
VVGTPGRVLDHLKRRMKVHRVAAVVLDEADRMLDMGFQPDLEKILKALPSPRQTVFFSATFPPSIRELCAKHQTNAVWVSAETESHATPDIRELVVRCDDAEKLGTLSWLLESHPHESALVFANQKIDVAKIEGVLRSTGASVASLHGDLEQRDRDKVMVKFRNGSTRVLVATDVAARGIDLENLELVINFDLPRQPEVYVHRIGRTGRAGKSGTAVSLCSPADAQELEAVENYTGRKLTPLQRDRPKREKSEEKAGAASERQGAPMDTLRLSGGRKDKLRAGDILGALTGEAGALDGNDIGKIEIHERFSFVAIRKPVSQKALVSLSAGRIKGRRFRVERVE